MSISINNQNFGSGREIQAFSNLGTNGIRLIGGNGERSQEANDRAEDHQFDQRKTPGKFYGSLLHGIATVCPVSGSLASKYQLSTLPDSRPVVAISYTGIRIFRSAYPDKKIAPEYLRGYSWYCYSEN